MTVEVGVTELAHLLRLDVRRLSAAVRRPTLSGFFGLAGPVDEKAGVTTGDGAGKPDAYSHLFILAYPPQTGPFLRENGREAYR